MNEADGRCGRMRDLRAVLANFRANVRRPNPGSAPLAQAAGPPPTRLTDAVEAPLGPTHVTWTTSPGFR